MGFQLPAGASLSANAQTGATITLTILGTQRTTVGTETPVTLYQNQLGMAVTGIYTVPASTSAWVSSIYAVNNAAVATKFALFLAGTAATNRITPDISLPANGFASYGEAGWQVYDANGTLQTGAGVSSIVRAAARNAPTAAFNTVETQLVSLAIPPNAATAGSTFRLTAYGICTSTVANAATFRCRIGATTLTGNIACAIAPVGTTTASSAPFMVDMIVTVRSIGAGGTVLGNGEVAANSAAGALQAFTGFQTLSATVATVAVDTTLARLIELTAVTAAATTTLTVHNAVVDWTLV